MFTLLALLSTARADLLPPPSRPDWDDPEPPLPDPPEDLEVALLVAASAALLLAARRAQQPRAAAS